MFNIILEQTHLCVITQVQRATKMSVGFLTNFIMKIKRGCSVLLGIYFSTKNVLGNNFNFEDYS